MISDTFPTPSRVRLLRIADTLFDAFCDSCGITDTIVDDLRVRQEATATSKLMGSPMFPRGFIAFCTLVLNLGICFSSHADDRAAHLKHLIEEHRLKAEALGEEASNWKVSFAGTSNNEFGLASFKCAALAYLFGKDDIFTRLGEIEETKLASSMTEEDLLSLSRDIRLHGNWALAADSILQESNRNRIEIWNLNCVRQYEIGEEHDLARIAPEAEFDVRGDQVHILGDIEAGFYERFDHVVANNPQLKTVVLGSGGGSVRDAILAGTLIRNRKLDTTLSADCYSACPLIFLGGVNRLIWSPYPRLGFHQVSIEGKATPSDDRIYAVIRQFADSMGANGGFLLNLMLASGPEHLNYPDVWELCEPAITTWVQRGCT
ncbi:MAG: hypothetical protein WBP38_04820 [Hyphomicrobium sp.]|nr:hypothetical protein [Hyphomicrobium sp.]